MVLRATMVTRLRPMTSAQKECVGGRRFRALRTARISIAQLARRLEELAEHAWVPASALHSTQATPQSPPLRVRLSATILTVRPAARPIMVFAQSVRRVTLYEGGYARQSSV